MLPKRYRTSIRLAALQREDDFRLEGDDQTKSLQGAMVRVRVPPGTESTKRSRGEGIYGRPKDYSALRNSIANRDLCRSISARSEATSRAPRSDTSHSQNNHRGDLSHAAQCPMHLDEVVTRSIDCGGSGSRRLPLFCFVGMRRMDTPESGDSIEAYVERRDGGYYIAGARISLDSIIYPFKNGASPESIPRSFPSDWIAGKGLRRNHVLSGEYGSRRSLPFRTVTIVAGAGGKTDATSGKFV